MSFLRRVIGGDKAPEWASFMKADEYRAFEAMVVADMEGRGYTVTLTGDGGLQADGGASPGTYGLSNVAQVCHAAERSEWPAIIRTHFASITELGSQDVAPLDIESAKPLLKARLYRVADAPPQILGDMVKVELAPDLVAALVLDLPTVIRGTSQDDLDHWATPTEELFRIASANMEDELRTYERSTIPLDEGFSLEVMAGNSFFVSSQAYRLAPIVGAPANGVLLALPNRHEMAWHVIEKVEGVAVSLDALIPLAASGYEQGPGSLTPDIYWWRDGTFTHVPAVIDRKGKRWDPPDELMTVLRSLV